MTNEQVYASASHILREFGGYAGDAGKDLAEAIQRDPAGYLQRTACNRLPILDEIARLMVGSLAGIGSSSRKFNPAPAAKRIIKSAEKRNRSMAGIFQSAGMYCACDGYQLIRLAEDLPELPHVESNFDADAAIEGAAQNETFPLPSVDDIKKAMAINKERDKNHQIPMALACGSFVNPSYLLNLVQALRDAEVYVPANKLSVIYFRGCNGDGLLCPVRVKIGYEYIDAGTVVTSSISA